MEELSEEQAETLRERLIELVVELENGLLANADSASPVVLDQSSVGRLSRMDAMQQQAMSQAAARLADLERQRIQSALGRMQSGDYGYCLICDEEIAEGRLRFDSSVLTCISCAQEEDTR